MSQFVVVDRIENGVAACEMPDRTMKMIPLNLLPPGVAEGDVLREEEGHYRPDPDETLRRREYNRALLRRLQNRD